MDEEKKITSPATNQGCHGVFTESFIVSIEAMVDVTGTLPSVSPLHFTKIIYKSQSTNSIPVRTCELKLSCFLGRFIYLNTHTRRPFSMNSCRRGMMVEGLSVQFWITSLQGSQSYLSLVTLAWRAF